MTKKIKYFCSLMLFSAALLSCESTAEKEVSENNSSKQYTLTKTATKHIPLDAQTPAKSHVLNIFEEDGKEYLGYLNSNLNRIQIYDFETGDLQQSTKIAKDGPEGIGRISGFKIVSKDSIFVLPTLVTKLYLVNSEGSIVKMVDFSYDKDKVAKTPSKSWTIWHNLLDYKGQKVLLTSGPVGDINKRSKSQLTNTPIAFTVDLTNEEVETVPV